MEKLLKPKEVSEMTGMAVQTLAKWRCIGDRGPRHIKIGGAVRYPKTEVERWIAEHALCNSAAQARAINNAS